MMDVNTTRSPAPHPTNPACTNEKAPDHSGAPGQISLKNQL
nr:MAG TPA: hypothetical protein [Caudoviricetes sp.]